MKSAKKLELIIPNPITIDFLKILKKHNIYRTIIQDTHINDFLDFKPTNHESSLTKHIISICFESKLIPILEELKPLIESFGGTFYVQDVMVNEDLKI